MNAPHDATHSNKSGTTFYKQDGKFWFVNHGNGWFVISGEPSVELIEI